MRATGGLEAEVDPVHALITRVQLCPSPCMGVGGGGGGTRLGFSVYLPPPLILIRVWSWLGQGKRGEGGQASVFHPSGYEPFTLVSNFGRKGSVLRSPRWEDSLGGGGCPGGCWCVQGPEVEAEAVALAAPRGRL